MSKVKESQLNDVLIVLGRQIAKVREVIGISQEEFAERCGWDRTRQSKIEAGKYNLTIETLIAIGNASKLYLDITFSKVS